MKVLKMTAEGTPMHVPGVSNLNRFFRYRAKLAQQMKLDVIQELLTHLGRRGQDEQCVCIMCLHNFR